MTTTETHVPDTTPAAVSRLLDLAEAASATTSRVEPQVRAAWLEAIADALDAARDDLIPLGEAETAIPAARLKGEVARTTGQLRLFAAVCRDGSFAEAIVDSADPEAVPPRPEIRRLLLGIGPVVVFAASNFPFAFSVAGGDTASALAVGCPVVVKAHPGHPRLSDATAAVVAQALRQAGAPEGTFGLAHGVDAGRLLVTDPRVRAIGFTGSLTGGRALFDLAQSRPDPVPFYGELGSLNPVYVTRSAAQARGEQIASDFVGSFTLGVGQLCTKPGLLFVPVDSGITKLATEAAGNLTPGPMLNRRIRETFRGQVEKWAGTPGVRVLTPDTAPALLATDVPTLLAHATTLLEEAFGPASLVVEYANLDELLAAARVVPGALTAAVFAIGDEPELAELLPIVQNGAGRLIWNGWPTGVAVTWGMHHGGPYPATTAPLHTSVGATAVRRWLRPVSFQNWPQHLLPSGLSDGDSVPVRRDGILS